jgi:protein-tyrosine phosphatase
VHVLFVCTGNIFRSLTAEYGLRAALPPNSGVRVSSAGTEDFPHVVKDIVREYLSTKGLDVRPHARRTLTREIFTAATVPVAMSTDHRAFMRESFGAEVPLFTEVCGLAAEPLPDVDDVVPNFETNPLAAAAHIRFTIDRILSLTPALAARIARGEVR